MPPPKLKLYKSGKLKPTTRPQPTEASRSVVHSDSSSNSSIQLDSENICQFEIELAWCIQTMESSLNTGKLNASQGILISIVSLCIITAPPPTAKKRLSLELRNTLISVFCGSRWCSENPEGEGQKKVNRFLQKVVQFEFVLVSVQDATKTLKILKSSNQSIIRKRQIMRTSFGDYRTKMAEEEKKLRLGLLISKVSIVILSIELLNFILGRRQIQFTNQANSKSFFVKRSVLSTIGKDKDFKFNFPATTEELIGKLNLTDSNDSNETKSLPEHKNGVSYCPTDNSFRFNFNIVEET